MENFKKAGFTPLSKDESRECNGGMSYEEYKWIINHGGCVFFPVTKE